MPLVRSPSLPFSSPLEHPKGVQGTRFLGRREGGREASPALQISPFAPVLRSSGRNSLTSRSPRTSIAPYAGHGTKTRGNGNLGSQGAGEPGTPTRAGRPWSGGNRRSVPRSGSCVLPAGKLQRRTARVGHNPRAERPAPLPIPIHPARPVTTSLSLEEV